MNEWKEKAIEYEKSLEIVEVQKKKLDEWSKKEEEYEEAIKNLFCEKEEIEIKYKHSLNQKKNFEEELEKNQKQIEELNEKHRQLRDLIKKENKNQITCRIFHDLCYIRKGNGKLF